jgi:hypothetical protein
VFRGGTVSDGGHKKKSSAAELFPMVQFKPGSATEPGAAEHFPMVSKSKLAEARAVLAYAPELADHRKLFLRGGASSTK